eukprot:g61857.t1
MPLAHVLTSHVPATERELKVDKGDVVNVIQKGAEWTLCSVRMAAAGQPPATSIAAYVPSSALADIDETKLTQTKQPLAKQLVKQEDAFVRVLTALVDLYVKPCQERGILSTQQLDVLVRNLEQILQAHRPFLQELQTEVQGRWSTAPATACLGKLLMKHFSNLNKSYVSYVNRHQGAVQLITALLSQSEYTLFQEIDRAARAHPAVYGQGIEALLMTPVRQISKYVVLVEEFLSLTHEAHSDHKDLKQALSLIKTLAHRLKEDLVASENRLQLLKLQEKFIGYGGPDKENYFVVPGRRFVRQGELYKVGRRLDKVVQVFLFNDLLVVGIKKGWQVKVSREIRVDRDFSLKILDDQKKKFPLQLTQQTEGVSMTLYSKKPAEKASWVKTFESVIKAAQNVQRSEVVWQNPAAAHSCKDCKKKFGLLLSKQHCVSCGYVVCGNCSVYRLKLPEIGGKRARVCSGCYQASLQQKVARGKKTLAASAEVGEFSLPYKLSIVCGTWNAGACNPQDNDDAEVARWLQHETENVDSLVGKRRSMFPGQAKEKQVKNADIYVVALQEIVKLDMVNVLIKDHDLGTQWADKIRKVLKYKYKLATSEYLVGTCILVLVRDALAKHVTGVQTSSIGVGKMSLGNKAACSVRFAIGDRNFCFVSAHLAAHQKQVAARNANYESIMDGINFHMESGEILSILSHETCIWMGDLNYRINDEREPQVVAKEITDNPSANWLPHLLARDQLLQEKAKGNVFEGWTESAISFAPTYKYKEGTSNYSAGVRMPSWCDRVLYRGVVKCLKYGCAKSIALSDHKPVFAQFEAIVNEWTPTNTRKLSNSSLLGLSDSQSSLTRFSVISSSSHSRSVRRFGGAEDPSPSSITDGEFEEFPSFPDSPRGRPAVPAPALPLLSGLPRVSEGGEVTRASTGKNSLTAPTTSANRLTAPNSPSNRTTTPSSRATAATTPTTPTNKDAGGAIQIQPAEGGDAEPKPEKRKDSFLEEKARHKAAMVLDDDDDEEVARSRASVAAAAESASLAAGGPAELAPPQPSVAEKGTPRYQDMVEKVEFEEGGEEEEALEDGEEDEVGEAEEDGGVSAILGLPVGATAGETDVWMWVPLEEGGFAPAKVLQSPPGEELQLQTLDGELVTVPPNNKLKVAEEAAVFGRPDDLLYLNVHASGLDPALLYQLELRYQTDQIYTALGDILVSINPFKTLDLYTNVWLERFMEMSKARLGSQPPHIFRTAAIARASLLEEGRSQCVVIGGESGAGKTECTKLVLQFLSCADGSDATSAAAALMQSNPLLEAFGNARTVRNDNSSRFGKWIQVDYGPMLSEERSNRPRTDSASVTSEPSTRPGSASVASPAAPLTISGGAGSPIAHVITGGRIVTYLLERTRVTRQGQGERNYHIFYQLCALLKAQNSEDVAPFKDEMRVLSNLGLSPDSSSYHYLKEEPVPQKDLRAGRETLQAMRKTNFSAQEIAHVLRCLVGILFLGNVKFEGKETERKVPGLKVLKKCQKCLALVDGLFCAQCGTKYEEPKGKKPQDVVAVAVEADIQKASAVLMLEAGTLRKALTSKIVKIVLEENEVPLTIPQAEATRDAMAKALYGQLFLWITDRLNRSLRFGNSGSDSTAAGAKKSISVLDIFGFEVFPYNSLEQFFINYANEKLQSYFNTRVFHRELDLYKSEGIAVDALVCPSSLRCLALFEGTASHPGILKMLDEENALAQEGGDTSATQKLRQRFLVTFGGQQLEMKGNTKAMSRFRKLASFNPHFWTSVSDKKEEAFIVNHYAGEVSYHIGEFIAKNHDRLSPLLSQLLQSSSNDLIHDLLTEEESQQRLRQNTDTAKKSESYAEVMARQKRQAAAKKKAMASVGLQFSNQLEHLVKSLDSSDPHFVRCLKPNNHKRPYDFHAGLVLEQIRSGGLPAAVQILRAGFPVRFPVGAFNTRYAGVIAQWCLPKLLQPNPSLESILQQTTSESPAHTPGGSLSTSAAPAHDAKALELHRAYARSWLTALDQHASTPHAQKELSTAGFLAEDIRLGQTMVFLSRGQHLALEALRRIAHDKLGTSNTPKPKVGPRRLPHRRTHSASTLFKHKETRARNLSMFQLSDLKSSQQARTGDKKQTGTAHEEEALPEDLADCASYAGRYPLSALCGAGATPHQQANSLRSCLLPTHLVSGGLVQPTAADKEEEDKEASDLFLNLLSATGLRYHAYPASCGLACLEMGFQHLWLRDELFAQLIKQSDPGPPPHLDGSADAALASLRLLYLALTHFRPISVHVSRALLSYLSQLAQAELKHNTTSSSTSAQSTAAPHRPDFSSRELIALACLHCWFESTTTGKLDLDVNRTEALLERGVLLPPTDPRMSLFPSDMMAEEEDQELTEAEQAANLLRAGFDASQRSF